MDTTWLPVTDGELLLWLNGFRQKLQNYQATLGLDTADLVEIELDYKAYAYMLAQIEGLRAELLRRVEFKALLRDGPQTATPIPFPSNILIAEPPSMSARPGMLSRLLRFVSLIKSAPGYSVEIGRDLGIEAIGVEIIPMCPQSITPITENGAVRIDFEKAIWKGVTIESQRADESVWTLLGTVYESPYIDARASLVPGIAETRRYRLQYVDAVEAVGCFSEPVQIVMPANGARPAMSEVVTVR